MVNVPDMASEAKKELVFTDAERKGPGNVRKTPIAFDEDSPETTPERALKFKRVNPPCRIESNPA